MSQLHATSWTLKKSLADILLKRISLSFRLDKRSITIKQASGDGLKVLNFRLFAHTGKHRLECTCAYLSNMSSGAGTAILWELAGRDNNLPFLIPLLKKHKEQLTAKHYVVSF